MGAGASSVSPTKGTRGAWPDPNEEKGEGGIFINKVDEADERLDKASVKRVVGAMHRLCRRRTHNFLAETEAIDELFATTADADGTISRAELRAAVRRALQEVGVGKLDEELRQRCGKQLEGDHPNPLALGPEYLPSLVKRGANPESLDDDGMSALMYAAGEGQVEQMRFLLGVYNDGMGVLDIDAACPRNGRTALWIACAGKQRAAMLYLLCRGADATIAGRTSPRKGEGEAVECTPAEVARRNGHEEVAGLVQREEERRLAEPFRIRRLRAGMMGEREFRQQILPPEETGLVAIVPETVGVGEENSSLGGGKAPTGWSSMTARRRRAAGCSSRKAPARITCRA